MSGYLRNLRGRLLSSEKFSEVFALWVFTLEPFPENKPQESVDTHDPSGTHKFCQKNFGLPLGPQKKTPEKGFSSQKIPISIQGHHRDNGDFLTRNALFRNSCDFLTRKTPPMGARNWYHLLLAFLPLFYSNGWPNLRPIHVARPILEL